MSAGKLSFTAAEYRVRENGTWITERVGVIRTGGKVGAVSVRVTNSSSVTPGRATRKLDFTAINPTSTTGSAQLLSWADGEEGIKYCEFAIINDDIAEGNESIPLTLGSYKGGAAPGTFIQCNLIIIDDDAVKGAKGINWRGLWNNTTIYSIDDAVFYNGSSYICISSTPTSLPPQSSPHWQLLAQKGEPGQPGLPGEKGDKGDKGEPGESGEPGLQGEKGDKGDPGEPGLQGLQGEPGLPGEHGLPGEKGDKGDPGEQGLPGEKGDKGDKGEPGERGLQGLQGVQGVPGVPGIQGLKGDKGDKGDPGLPGIQGFKGDKGDRGEQGLQGIPGPQGLQGIPGVPGAQGLQGIPGVPGAPGAKGDKGDKGDKGEPGDIGLIAKTITIQFSGEFGETNLNHQLTTLFEVSASQPIRLRGYVSQTAREQDKLREAYLQPSVPGILFDIVLDVGNLTWKLAPQVLLSKQPLFLLMNNIASPTQSIINLMGI